MCERVSGDAKGRNSWRELASGYVEVSMKNNQRWDLGKTVSGLYTVADRRD